jgi:hypothetical protein
MVLGDFNCIISDLDTKSGNMVTSNNLKLILENIIDTLNVVDTFRILYLYDSIYHSKIVV